ncbi:TetR family transcriptional regulator [Streptomyces sp. 3211.6]|uniref:ScbR family autoregulator-binding transcription factor n=1 Tax=Streptomyces TaxID=1883 RepID=UPI0009A53C30|nr:MULTISPECIES: ScbR family autoregulator-binding transcription factor [Streptomyces]RKS96983.1 TetR family transcriptional regulator [Streptomyces sp. 3211.6]RPF25350.1 TetR family transcriptional regulator [Streptomyces sp. Ag109_G2-6]
MQERSERTRRRLVFAGAELFHRNGYANATLGEIAGAAGVTKGALYFHFASKDELADAVQRRGCGLLHEAVRGLREGGASPLQALIDTTHWLARTLHEDPAIPASFRITKECAGQQPPAVDFHGAWLAVVYELLRMARDVGELPLDPPDAGLDGGDPAGDGAPAADRWESAEALVSAAVCGIEVLAGTGLSYAELQRKVAALWGLLLPSLVGAERAREYRTRAGRDTRVADGERSYEFLGSGV